MTEIMSAGTWSTNGQLLADVARLFPLSDVFDITFGRGLWWTEHRPVWLSGTDLKHPKDGLAVQPDEHAVGVDFRRLPMPDSSLPVVAFDPPYLTQTKAQQAASTLRTPEGDPDFGDRYGLESAAATVPELRRLIAHGMTEATRVLEHRGLLLVKCMNFITGGKHRPFTHWALNVADTLDLDVAAQFVHVSGAGPQPTTNPDGTPRRVLSPRGNYSTLLVLKKTRR
jgi:hypothetical protein